jgi:hypothetical protein
MSTIEYLTNLSPFFWAIFFGILVAGILVTKGDPLAGRVCRIGLTLLFVLRGFEYSTIISAIFFMLAAFLWVPKISGGGAHVFIKLIDDWDIHIPTDMNKEANRLARLIRKGKTDKAEALASRLKKKGHNSVYIDTMLAMLPSRQQKPQASGKLILKDH